MTGLFITFEGGEGGGKSTQVRRLADALVPMGHQVVLTREPGGSPGAEAIRKLLVEGNAAWDGLTEAMLHNAARRDHLIQKIWPALKEGLTVISDRFTDSTIAYQAYGHGVDKAIVTRINDAATRTPEGRAFTPHLTFILDLPVEVGLERARLRGGGEDRYERMGLAFHEHLRQGFLDIAAADPARCRVIDAARDVDSIHQDILAATTAYLKARG